MQNLVCVCTLCVTPVLNRVGTCMTRVCRKSVVVGLPLFVKVLFIFILILSFYWTYLISIMSKIPSLVFYSTEKYDTYTAVCNWIIGQIIILTIIIYYVRVTIRIKYLYWFYQKIITNDVCLQCPIQICSLLYIFTNIYTVSCIRLHMTKIHKNQKPVCIFVHVILYFTPPKPCVFSLHFQGRGGLRSVCQSERKSPHPSVMCDVTQHDDGRWTTPRTSVLTTLRIGIMWGHRPHPYSWTTLQTSHTPVYFTHIDT